VVLETCAKAMLPYSRIGLEYYARHKKRDTLTKIVTAKLPVNENLKNW
jgi:hypothetical protein